MPNDDPQPAPAVARNFVAETATKIFEGGRNVVVYAGGIAFYDRSITTRDEVEALVAAGVRAGLRRAAEIARDMIETHPDGLDYERPVDRARNWGIDAVADAIDREAGAA